MTRQIHLKKNILYPDFICTLVSFLFEVTMVVVNFASPSLVRDDVQSVCKKMIGQLVDTSEKTVGIYGLPGL